MGFVNNLPENEDFIKRSLQNGQLAGNN